MGSQSASAHPSVPARPLGMEASVPRARGARSRARAVAASVLVGLVLWRPLPVGAGAAWFLFFPQKAPPWYAFALSEPDLCASTSINFRTPQKIKSCSGTLSIVLRLKNKPGKAPDGYHGAAPARSSARNFTLKPSGKQVNFLEKPSSYV